MQYHLFQSSGMTLTKLENSINTMHISIYHRTCLKAIVAIPMLFMTYTVTAAEPDKTPEDVQKKAVIIKHDAQLFKKATSSSGKEAKFMQIYFVMKPTRNNRTPVSFAPYKKGDPDGWLERGSFMEWNSLQMVKLEAQSGRKLAKVFETQGCADKFGNTGQDDSGCQNEKLGAEPNRFDPKMAEQQLLIPVFDKGNNSYQGGFIQIYEDKNSRVKPTDQPGQPTAKPGEKKRLLGYDIVFAVDSTRSMGEYFPPTTKVLQKFVEYVKGRIGTGIGSGTEKIETPLRMGVLFYRDRLVSKNLPCNLSYLTKWGQELTNETEKVIRALQVEIEADCGSEDPPEAVLDGLNRVIIDTQWQDNSYRAIILVGDASPHTANSGSLDGKNPMQFNTASILKDAEEKSIRLLTFKLGDDEQAFEELAFSVTQQSNKGRYAVIPLSDVQTFKTNLEETMKKEWAILEKTVNITQDIIDTGGSSADIDVTQQTVRDKYDLTPYEAMIIRLPKIGADPSQMIPQFVKGWLPHKIEGKLAISEYLFLNKKQLSNFTNAIENIAEAAEIGEIDGPDAFIQSVRSTIASQLNLPVNEVFRSGESLTQMLMKTNILPFKTQLLALTPEEFQTWKAADYERINKNLSEKVEYLRDVKANPTNFHYFGDKPFFYVPRKFFP